jgi:hypothetical protein
MHLLDNEGLFFLRLLPMNASAREPLRGKLFDAGHGVGLPCFFGLRVPANAATGTLGEDLDLPSSHDRVTRLVSLRPSPELRAMNSLLMTAILLLPTTLSAQTTSTEVPAATPRKTSIGVTRGWGAPYAAGLDVGRFVTDKLELTAGAGFGVSGGKLGVGARYYLRPDRRCTPYFGLNLVRSGRVEDASTTIMSGVDVEYDVRPNPLLHLRSGLRLGQRRVSWLTTLGYGIRLAGNPITFNEPDEFQRPGPRPITVRRARRLGPGGLELSVGLRIVLGK